MAAWLIGCEESGTVREALRALGHDAWSCDLQPARDNSPYHIQGDVLIAVKSRIWNGFIVHPDCTYLSVSGQHWNGRTPGRQAKTDAAVRFFIDCIEIAQQCGIEKIGAENPISIISTKWRKPDQIIQPYNFGHDASKQTCLWTIGLPLLKPTRFIPPRFVCVCGVTFGYDLGKYGCPDACGGIAKPRWANQTDSGQNKLGPSPTRKRDRSKTYQGIADAMALQWAGWAKGYQTAHAGE